MFFCLILLWFATLRHWLFSGKSTGYKGAAAEAKKLLLLLLLGTKHILHTTVHNQTCQEYIYCKYKHRLIHNYETCF